MATEAVTRPGDPRDMLDRERVLAIAREAAREYVETIRRAQFEDMGDDECETCRRARLRKAWRK